MNGRIYDPTLGRFLQADPRIQAPSNSQSFNRYSYVLNNPLSYTDPSGYFFKKLLRHAAKTLGFFSGGIIGAIVTDWTMRRVFASDTLSGLTSAILNFIPGCQGWCSAAFSSARTLYNTGSLKGAFTSAALGYIGSWAGANYGIIGSAIAGGAIADLMGGNFGHGFWAVGLNAALGGHDMTSNPVANVLISAVIGGAISKVTGGKFANGAASAAFAAALRQDWNSSFMSRNGEPNISAANEKVAAQNALNIEKAKEFFDKEYEGLLDSIEIKYKEMKGYGEACVTERCIYLPKRLLTGEEYISTPEIVESIAHEYLHVHANETIGVPQYILGEILTTPFTPNFRGSVHNWIYEQGANVRLYHINPHENTRPVLPGLSSE